MPGFCWTCGDVFTERPALDAHQMETGHEMDQPDHPLRQEPAMSRVNLKHLMPINTVGGFDLGPRSYGVHHDPTSTQRVIGAHVYIFRTLADRIDVWRSEMADEHGGYRWTLVHTYR